jgi:hypothetical protein
VRNVCATEKKWVVSMYSTVWYEWPKFPLSTKHHCQSNRVSEPLARTYALQFTISCFRFTEHCSGVTDIREKILTLERPADHLVLLRQEVHRHFYHALQCQIGHRPRTHWNAT